MRGYNLMSLIHQGLCVTSDNASRLRLRIEAISLLQAEGFRL